MMKDLLNNKKIRRARDKLSTLEFKRIGFAIGLILVLMMSNTALADDGGTMQQTAPYWQATYWNNTSLSGTPVLQRQEASLNHNWGFGSPNSSVQADHFSARWTRYIDVRPGAYRFNATSDDGIRVWVDSDLIIDQWHDHPPTTYGAQAYLGGGHHLVKVEYYERGGVAVAEVSWTLATDTPQYWRGEYYNNKTLSGTPSLMRDDQQINFSWGSGSPAPGQVNADVFSVRWTRSLDLAAGNYRFSMTVDDGARLYVNGHLLIDAWKDQPPTTYSSDIYLPGGSVTVQLEYYENGGSATAQLSWENAASANWRVYSNPDFAVTLKYPGNWQPVPGYSDPETGEKYAGTDGFFMLNAMDGESIDSVTAAEAYHKLQPYGSQPTIESLQIQGQEARLILPSADASMGDQSALIVRYPQPVNVAGHPCSFFVLYADQSHIRAIGETLRFTESPAPTGTVIVDDTDPGFVKNGSSTGWHTAAEGYGGHLTWTRNNDRRRANYNWARWYPELAASRYEVFVYIPERYASTSQARYWVSHCDGYTLRIVDQAVNGGRWVSLGTYRFCGVLPHDHVSLSDVTYEPYLSRLIAFDAVKWVPASATPMPPTPRPTPVPTPERILFAPGATQTTVEGYLPANSSKLYVMRVAAGQFIEMNATVGTMGRGLRFSIVGADGTVVRAMGEAHVRTVVPSTQDYYIELASDVGAVNYRMSVLIPVRIRFAPGATSAQTTGSLAAGEARHYVLRALAGQRMIVAPHTGQGQVKLIISGVDGQVLLSGRVGRPGGGYDGILPTTQDYLITVEAVGGTGTDYTLETIIPAGKPASGITIVGTAADVSLSARIIMLREPVEGFSVIALTEETELVSIDGGRIALRAIRPGMRIEASGQPGESNALLASKVRLLEPLPASPSD